MEYQNNLQKGKITDEKVIEMMTMIEDGKLDYDTLSKDAQEEIIKRKETIARDIEFNEKEKSINEEFIAKIDDYKIQEEKEFDRIKREYRDRLQNINHMDKAMDSIALVIITGGFNIMPALMMDVSKMFQLSCDYQKQMELLQKQIQNNDKKLNQDFIKEIVTTKNAYNRAKTDQKPTNDKKIDDNTPITQKPINSNTIHIQADINITNNDEKYPFLNPTSFMRQNDFKDMSLTQYMMLLQLAIIQYEINKEEHDRKQKADKEDEEVSEKIIETCKKTEITIDDAIEKIENGMDGLNETLDKLVNLNQQRDEFSKMTYETIEKDEDKNLKLHTQENKPTNKKRR